MHTVIDTLQNAGIFILFLAARFAVLLIVLAVLTVIFLAGLAVVRLAGRVRRHALGLTSVDGLAFKSGVDYSPGHWWLRRRGDGTVRVGLDDLAQHVLASVSDIILPQLGQPLQIGDLATVVRCGKRSAALPSPINGRVVAINRRVLRTPSRIHRDPYAGGWLFAVEPGEPDLARLPRVGDPRNWLSAEGRRLSRFFERELGTAAADGGELVAAGPLLLTETQWDDMAQSFLLAENDTASRP